MSAPDTRTAVPGQRAGRHFSGWAPAVRELRTNRAQHVASVVVAFLGALLGTVLIESEAILQRQSSGGGFYIHPYVPLLLGVLGIVFTAIATFVAVIVTMNTFAVVLAGRAPRTALYRLLGASARSLRRGVAVEGAIVGAIGAALGVLAGIGVAAAVSGFLIATNVFLPLAMSFAPPTIVLPFVVGVAATTTAAFLGTRQLVGVSPVEALGRMQEPSIREVRSVARERRGWTTALITVGAALLIAGVGVGYVTPYGLLLAVPGGALSFLGFVTGSGAILPAVLRLTGRLLGASVTSRLAAENAVRYPARAARTTIGLVIGITLVTMFGVAGQTYSDVATRINAALPKAAQDSVAPFLGLVLGVIGILVGFSLLIAAVGLVNSLSLSVSQRRREIGLLRALGFPRRNVRRMIIAECVQLTITGTLIGVVLGTIYGWAGTVTAMSSDHHVGGYFWFSFPAWLLIAILISAVLLATTASLVASRRATQIPALEAVARG
jgi:putative ABC transport system permease protein